MGRNNNLNNKYNFIFEGTRVVRNQDIEILDEIQVPGGKTKVVGKALLQEADVLNANKRRYPKQICESIVNQLAPKATSRSLLMEIDHPLFVSSDPEVLKKRATIVEINNCGALLRDIIFENGRIHGVFETLSGFKGPDLYNLITKDKVDVGFSLRALGAIETLSDGTIIVKDPIRPITYDFVSNPSHVTSRVLEFLPESASEFMSSEQVLYETDLSILSKDHITIADGDSVVVRFIDDIINERFYDIISKKIKFNF
jgi:hypothetical protein